MGKIVECIIDLGLYPFYKNYENLCVKLSSRSDSLFLIIYPILIHVHFHFLYFVMVVKNNYSLEYSSKIYTVNFTAEHITLWGIGNVRDGTLAMEHGTREARAHGENIKRVLYSLYLYMYCTT